MPHHGVFIRDQADAVSRKHEVIVISSKVDYESFKLFSWTTEESVFGKVKEYRVVVNRSIPFINQFNYLVISVWVAFKIARRFRPDLIHGNIAYPGGIWSYALSRITSRPFVVSDHTSRFTDNFRSAFHRILTTFSMRRANRVIAVSAYSAEKIRAVLHRDVDVIPNMIHVNEYAVSPPTRTTVQMGFLGGLSSEIHRKGLDLLIKALAGVQKDYVLHVGGQGKFLEYYKDLARTSGILEKCRFQGFVDHVPDFMRKLHFFVSASRIEAFGMVIVEAMASGLPVVTTNSGGPADFMDETCGVMVPNENVERLREAILWMIDHHGSFDRSKIRMKAVNSFSPEAFLEKIDDLYTLLCPQN